MAAGDVILIGDLPKTLVEAVGRDLAMYTIALLRWKDPADYDPVDLLGTGVCVSAGDTRAILTAQHVVERLPRSGRFGIFLGPTNTPHSIDADGVVFLEIARGREDAAGPDVGAVILAPSIASSINAKKVFYSLDKRREQVLQRPSDLREGAWFVNGFLAEGTTVTTPPDRAGPVKWFYKFSGVGGPDSSRQVGRYDYFDFPVSHEARAQSPKSWGGMSGGGLWQVQLKGEGTAVEALPPYVLSGVLFYQLPTTATVCGVRAHGRRSVYEAAYDAITGSTAP